MTYNQVATLVAFPTLVQYYQPVINILLTVDNYLPLRSYFRCVICIYIIVVAECTRFGF